MYQIDTEDEENIYFFSSLDRIDPKEESSKQQQQIMLNEIKIESNK